MTKKLHGGEDMARIVSFALALAVSLTISGSALAHAYLKSAVPPKNSTVRSAPAEVTIDFTEAVEPKYCTVEVQDSAGARVDNGDVHAGDASSKRLVVSLKPLAPGTYKVIWHATSTDTHKTQGTYRFTVKP
jgi:methionine-rich copper-binding protein CopC